MVAPIPPLPPVGALGATAPTTPAAPGFGDALSRGLQQVSQLEHTADAVTRDIASGGPSQVHDLMIATTKASLGVEMLVQVRNRAVEAYQEIMRMPL